MSRGAGGAEEGRRPGDGTRPATDGGTGKPYFVYMLRCADGSLYSGITTDVVRRLREHRAGGGRAARYTRSHGVDGLVAVWRATDRSQASRFEWQLHHMTRAQKLALVASPSDPGVPEPVGRQEVSSLWEAAVAAHGQGSSSRGGHGVRKAATTDV